MYKKIEEVYKKKSPYNIIMKKLYFIYFIFIVLSLIFNIIKYELIMILIFILMVVIILIVCEKTLNKKLYISFYKKTRDDISLSLIIKHEEYEIFKRYSLENHLYNEKALLCIVDHYRNLYKSKYVSGNLLTILSIAIPSLLSFYTKTGFDFNGLTNALPYLICFTIIIVLLYIICHQLFKMKELYKGDVGMIDRLEEIFSELYIECVNSQYKNKTKKTNVINKKLYSKKNC